MLGFVVLLAVPAHLDLSQPAAPGSTSSGGSSGFLGGLLTLVWRTYLTPNPEIAAVCWTVAMVAGLVLPALVLLAGGLIAWTRQRRPRTAGSR